MEGHTDRFAAIVSQRSISNYLTKCLYTDIGYYANWLQMGAYPWEDFDKIWSMSPLKEAVNGRTPLLLIQSDEDYRCWMDEAVQMFSAVKRQGVDTRMVLFHGENHELSRGGKPENRLSRLKELMGWFDKYLS
jgi:dipeptidyl aminopeptidase/acylaminoacyl peptidase